VRGYPPVGAEARDRRRRQDDDTRLFLGPSLTGEFLEVLAIVRDDGSELAIHAMKMRRKYLPLLPGD
jgi:hypothetical protein